MNQSEKHGLRRHLPLLALLLVLLLAAAFVLLLPAIKEKYPSETALQYQYNPTYQTLAERDEAILQSITVSQIGGEEYTLLYQNGALLLETDGGEAEPISALIQADILKYATTVYIQDTVTTDTAEVAEHLADMGLEPPQIEVTATYTDGSSDTFAFGILMPGATEYYYRWSGDDGVYLCSSGVYETFEYTAAMLLSIEQPSILSSLIERISIVNSGEEPIVCTFTPDGEDTVLGTLQSPFTYPMDADAADGLLTAAENFRLGTRLAAVTDANRSTYGFDTPQAVVKITQREGLYSSTDAEGAVQSSKIAAATITLTIGDPGRRILLFLRIR